MQVRKIKNILLDNIKLWQSALAIIEQAEKESPIPAFEALHKPIEQLNEVLRELEGGTKIKWNMNMSGDLQAVDREDGRTPLITIQFHNRLLNLALEKRLRLIDDLTTAVTNCVE